MSEKLFAILLRLYPARFRARYGEEALQLLVDRLRDETGFLPRLHLLFDLLIDTAVAVPRAHRIATLSPAAAPASLFSAFSVPGPQSLRPAVILLAGILALSGLAGFAILISYAGINHSSRLAEIEKHAAAERTWTNSGFLGIPLPPPPPPPSWDLLESHPVKSPDATRQPQGTGISTRPSANPAAIANGIGAASPAPLAVRTSDRAASQHPVLSSNIAVSSSPAGEGSALNATTAILQAFQTHDIVLFGEMHGNQQEYAWLCQLVNNPAFDDRVDDIVVEFGNARYQDIVDRYLAGDNVSVDQVRPAWRNMIASVPPVSPVYGDFYEAIRQANLAHHEHHPLRLVMGSPPGNWDKIRTVRDLAPFEAEREQWYAQVVKTRVLAKHHRALLIMGAGHFLRGFSQSLSDELLMHQHRPVPPVDPSQLGPGYIERTLRAAGANPWLVVFGTNAIDDRGHTDARFHAWHDPTIVSLPGSWAGSLPAQPILSAGHAPATPLTLADQADALLYLGPCSTLTNAFATRSEVEGTPYGKEIARRDTILVGHPVPFPFGEIPACAQPHPAAH